jgi:uncharacterized protein DUF6636
LSETLPDKILPVTARAAVAVLPLRLPWGKKGLMFSHASRLASRVSVVQSWLRLLVLLLLATAIENTAAAAAHASQLQHNPAHSGVLLSEAGLLGLKTPSGNIQCMIDDYGMADNSYPPFLRCDILDTTTTTPKKPSWCEFDWGNAFSIKRDGQLGERLCVSDSVANDNWPTLAYGTVWQQLGFTCRSEQSGLTCFNAKHHGFTLSRSAQKLF